MPLRIFSAARGVHNTLSRLRVKHLFCFSPVSVGGFRREDPADPVIHLLSEDIKNPCHFECPHRLSDKLLKSSAASHFLSSAGCA
ncbi:hypothetical protein C3424_23640 [Citrobacter amalonaticus]|nr:hypothetical protein C3424_23640 [Citrobacter amalonaticus]